METSTPTVSVIVPTYQRRERLADCLAALKAQEGVPVEVVVVDDGDDEPMALVVEASGMTNARCLRQDNSGPAAARNRGAAAARAPFLAFTDDDCRPRPGWLAAMAGAHEAAPDALLGGHAQASQDLIGFLYEAGGEGAGYFASNNIACGRAAFEALGGFDETFPLAGGEDRDFGLRWGKSGRPLRFVEGAVVDHHHALSLRAYWRQHANYGRGARHLRSLGDEGGGHGFGGPGFYASLVTYPLRKGGPKAAARSALLALAQAATAYGFATPPKA